MQTRKAMLPILFNELNRYSTKIKKLQDFTVHDFKLSFFDLRHSDLSSIEIIVIIFKPLNEDKYSLLFASNNI